MLLALMLAPGAAWAKPGKQAEADASTTKGEEKVRYAQIVLSGVLPESAGASGPFGSRIPNLRKTIARLDKAAQDDSIAGVVLEVRGLAIGTGKVNELRGAIKRFRESGKKVHAMLEVASAADYRVAAACDEITMPESGYLLATGVRLEPVFYKGLLTNLGVRADFIRMGNAKGAGETFTRKRWSEPVRANLEAMAGDLYQQMIEAIALDRPITEAEAERAIDLGLLTATAAKEAGLIDRVAYADELRAGLADRHPSTNLVYVQNYGKKSVDTDFSGPTGIFKLMKLFAGAGGEGGGASGKKLAVVYAVGPIMTGKSQEDLFGSATLGSTTLVEALDEADRDEKVAAIVLRIDSPGGSAVASDLIWRKIQSIDKPVVASMGDTAASGGYYIAMGCDKVLAEPGTLTGSIGVVSGKFAFRGLYRKLGLTTDVISRGENSAIFSGLRPWSETERAAMMRLMEDTYEQFTRKAAEGRGMAQDALKELASGKVYTGRQAKANGLVDGLGTLRDAIREAKKLAGIDAEQKVRLEVLPEPPEFFDAVFGGAEGEKEVRVSLDGLPLPAELSQAARRAALWARVLQQEPVALLLPYQLQTR